MEGGAGEDSLLLVLDSAAILEGANVEARRCVTTPEVVAEVGQGGATGRRMEALLAAGLEVMSASPGGLDRVREVARATGALGRLSGADLSILGLAVDVGEGGRLLTDDYTVLDVSRRLGLAATTVTKPGIDSTRDWGARCRGCGRSYPAHLAGRACPVCGAEVRLRVRRA